MANYKNIDLDDQLVGMIRHMQIIDDCRAELNDLQTVWDNLTLLGHLSGTGNNMNATRQSFQKLTSSLLNQLVSETLRKTIGEMQSKAQVAIDILVRNLFERTADIGFLATDADIREVLLKANTLKGQYSKEAELKEPLARIAGRFAEYVAKYSVYSDIVLFDTEGEIVLRLNEKVNVKNTEHPLFQAALETTDAYVETFDRIDFLPNDATALVYSYRVLDSENLPLGVLSLCFRFENEMNGIFADLVTAMDWSVICLLDNTGQVIASSDKYHIPLGAKLPLVLTQDYQVQRFGGQEYLGLTRRSTGYQGYAGPDWYAHVMLPLQQAFNQSTSSLSDKIPQKVLDGIMERSQLFSENLRNIPIQAEQIQRELNRSVWNGNIRQSRSGQGKDNGFSKILLWEISNTGARTQAVFQHSIDNLHATVVSSVLEDSHFQASLAIDIMDRNLYERANDCRWWALTSTFRELLAAPQLSSEGKTQITDILFYINSLYTVYTNLIVFDSAGRIVAVSNAGEEALVGQMIGEEWSRRALSLSSSQGYVVSGFEETRFYQDRPTYIYAAAIRDLEGGRIVGGIGIVFDSAPQFEAMLRDALPKDAHGDIDAASFAAFVSREGHVIACSDERFKPGEIFPVASVISGLNPGDERAGVYIFDGQYYAMGAHASSGYREYKDKTDHYQNEVIAVVGKTLCVVAEQSDEIHAPACPVIRSERSENGNTLEIATFRLGDEWFGIRGSQIIEAVDPTNITPAPGAGSICVGYLVFDKAPIPVFDIRTIICTSKNQIKPGLLKNQQVMIIEKNAATRFGIMTDSLGEIPEINETRLCELPLFIANGALLADAAVAPDNAESESLLLVLSSDRLAQQLATNFSERPSLKVLEYDAEVN
ncbi:MAG: hypothetical protein CTY34_08825 [Methylobacter sp.]|nr:MAG: hypothetical protein CTY34_08825 [Methylobacter sp.]PPD20935.1 MAG: hypothetical protein CTY24_08545 [Methylobacter sp.]